MKRISELHNLLKSSEFSKKVQVIFATTTTGDDYDPEYKNFTKTNLSPLTINAIVRQISPEALVWKQYGLSNIGALELLTEKRYKTWLENASQLIIDGDKYAVFKDGTGGKAIIQERFNDIIRVVISKR